MKFINTLEQYILNGEIEQFLINCHLVSDCIDIKTEILHLSARYSLHGADITKGIASYKEGKVNENKILLAIVNLMERIYNEIDQAESCLENVQKRGVVSGQLLSVCELLPVVVESIQKDNQRILSDYFTGREDVEDVMRKMTDLFNRQNKRREFASWVEILSFSAENTESEVQKNVLALKDVLLDYRYTLYSHDSVRLPPNRIIGFFNQVLHGAISDTDITKFHMTVLDRFPPKEARMKVRRYLEYLRDATEKVTVYCHRIKHLLESQ